MSTDCGNLANMAFVTIYVTHKNLAQAKKVANHLLKKRLIACANFWPIKSAYWRKGKIQNDNEIVTILKTKKENWPKIKTEIKKIHPYEVPCIEKINVEADIDYEDWIKRITK